MTWKHTFFFNFGTSWQVLHPRLSELCWLERSLKSFLIHQENGIHIDYLPSSIWGLKNQNDDSRFLYLYSNFDIYYTFHSITFSTHSGTYKALNPNGKNKNHCNSKKWKWFENKPRIASSRLPILYSPHSYTTHLTPPIH